VHGVNPVVGKGGGVAQGGGSQQAAISSSYLWSEPEPFAISRGVRIGEFLIAGSSALLRRRSIAVASTAQATLPIRHLAYFLRATECRTLKV
jgi:hypothetical protein